MDERKNKKRDRIGFVLYAAYLTALVLSVVILVRVVCIQLFWSTDDKIYNILTPSSTRIEEEPTRGNILDCKGRLLALTVPRYQLYMDCTVQKSAHRYKADEKARKEFKDPKIRQQKADKYYNEFEQTWKDSVRVLCNQLAEMFPEKSASEYYNTIIKGRETNRQYVMIGHPVNRKQYKELLNFTLFREGRNKSGRIIKEEFTRRYPYGTLARRTIGFIRDKKYGLKNNLVGIEGKFNDELHGKTGIGYYRYTEQGIMRDNDSIYVEAVDGQDVVLTLDVDYQEIADNALREQIEGRRDIQGATLALMEVKTGAIRAMVNLVYNPETDCFEESSNMIVGRKNEPGSVFKTVTLMSALNDGYVHSLDETMPLGNGTVPGTDIVDKHIVDYINEGKTEISIIDGFKISSNYVFAKLALDHYGDNQRRFIENIKDMYLGDSFDFDLDGFTKPSLPEADRKNKLPDNTFGRLGFGYISEETPLHILTFYNAIAGKGRMMRPYLVECLMKDGEVVSRRGPAVLKESICSRAVADTLTRALKAVTSDGTAKWALRGSFCEVAGKTGTSFGSFGKSGYKDRDGKRKYQSTFVGFFPADAPVYSIISTVYSFPSLYDGSLQGSGVPARAIKTTVNGIYNIDPAFRTRLTQE